MELQLLEKSPHIASLLVKLYDTQKLHSAGSAHAAESRKEVASVMASLLEHELAVHEQELVADVLITIVRRAENDLRRALAERLAKMEQVPLRLILHLCNDQVQVAQPILMHSKVLSDLDLSYIIRAQGPEYWRIIAERQALSGDIADLLVGTKEDGTALVLLQNKSVLLSVYALEILTGMASENEIMADLLLKREEMLPELANRLYRHVSEELKAYIHSFFGKTSPEIVKAADDLFLEFIDSGEGRIDGDIDDAVTQAVANAAGRPAEPVAGGQTRLTEAMDLLRRGKVDEFVTCFIACAGLPAERTKDVFTQASARKLAIICRALRVAKSDFSLIYLYTHRIRSEDRLLNHNDLMKALSYFDSIKQEAAGLIVTRI